MRSTIAACAALTLALVGCSSGSDVEDDPQGSLREAVSSIADYDGIEMVLTFDGDRDAIAASADDPEEADAIELLLDSEIVVIGSGESEEDAQFEVRVNLDAADVFELRVLPQPQVFLRLDLDGLADAIDDPSLTQDLDAVIADAEQFGFGDVAQVAVDGGWIEITGVEQMMEFAEGFGGGMGQPQEEPSEDELEELQDRIVAAFERFLDEDVTVAYVDDEGPGERVRATADGPALQRLFDDVVSIGADAGGVDPTLLQELEGEDLPDDLTVAVDLWLDGGEVSQMGLDLSQFDEDGEVPPDTFLLIGLSEFTGEVEAPADAEPFDLFGLISGFLFGGMDGGMGDMDGLGDLEDDALLDEDLEGLDDEDVASECTPQEEVEEFGLEELVEEGFIEVC